jgi:hypothetical protein
LVSNLSMPPVSKSTPNRVKSRLTFFSAVRPERLSFATLLHDVEGASIKDAQAQLGHAYASRTTLDVYTKTLPKSRVDAIERLEERLRKAAKRAN